MLVKAILDTNVWISALIATGAPRQLVGMWLQYGLFTVVYPSCLIEELKSVPSKPKLAARIHEDDLKNLIALIQEEGFLFEPQDISAVSRDPDDDPFLACARASGSDFIVTGDNDLLCLSRHHDTQIVTPKQFLDELTSRM